MLLLGLAGGARAILGAHRNLEQPAAIQSVTGDVTTDRLGLTLMHEHVLVDFIGADKVSPNRYSVDEAFKVVLPHLQQVRALGCETLVECTPAYLGRDPVLLRRLSEASGVRILTNTGYYGAAKDKHLPAHALPKPTSNWPHGGAQKPSVASTVPRSGRRS
jgi:phosphotriesterase-related protein